MDQDIEKAAEGVKPVRRTKISQLGDKLDAAEKANDDWASLYFEYEPLAIKRALETRPPKISITTTAALWQADAMASTLYKRRVAIEADQHANNTSDKRSMRTAADLEASLAVTKRDFRIVCAALTKYKDKEKRKKNVKRYQQRTALKIGRAIQAQIGRVAS